jgi:hypothetical protein
VQEFLGTLVIVVTSEGLDRVDDRKSRGAGGDCESDSNKYEDFFHGRHPLKKGSLNHITVTQVFATGIGRAGMPKRRLQPGKPGGFYGVDVGLGSSAEFKRRMADFLNSFQ